MKHFSAASVVAAMVLATLVSFGTPSAAQAHNPNPGVYPLHARPFGSTWGEWTAAWWRWAISIPVANHPLFDNGPCDTGQSGHVFFIGGSFTGAPAVRDCTVPAGRSILFPIANAECSNVEPPPFFGSNEAEMRACARSFIDPLTVLVATIDGRPVRELFSYRVDSPFFTFSAPADGLFGPDPVTGQSVSDGYWLFLHPLSAGRHTIHLEAPEFGQNVTYNLTVRRGRRRHDGDNIADVTEEVQPGTWSLVKELYR